MSSLETPPVISVFVNPALSVVGEQVHLSGLTRLGDSGFADALPEQCPRKGGAEPWSLGDELSPAPAWVSRMGGGRPVSPTATCLHTAAKKVLPPLPQPTGGYFLCRDEVPIPDGVALQAVSDRTLSPFHLSRLYRTYYTTSLVASKPLLVFWKLIHLCGLRVAKISEQTEFLSK